MSVAYSGGRKIMDGRVVEVLGEHGWEPMVAEWGVASTLTAQGCISDPVERESFCPTSKETHG